MEPDGELDQEIISMFNDHNYEFEHYEAVVPTVPLPMLDEDDEFMKHIKRIERREQKMKELAGEQEVEFG
jgi:hypothetical protein